MTRQTKHCFTYRRRSRPFTYRCRSRPEPRAASVVAVGERVRCLSLEKEAFLDAIDAATAAGGRLDAAAAAARRAALVEENDWGYMSREASRRALLPLNAFAYTLPSGARGDDLALCGGPPM